MRLKNKKTGEICDFKIIADYDDCTSGWRLEKHDGTVLFYDHIDEIHSEWEDIPEEPKEYWYIDWTPEIGAYHTRDVGSDADERQKEIGNYFETKEEAEKAVETLKAWKRLKDKGFRFDSYDVADREGDDPICGQVYFKGCNYDKEEIENDLYLLFGGEE